MGILKCVCVGREKDVPPVNIHQAIVGIMGISGDVHYGTKRQISILPYEEVEKYYAAKGESVKYGSFGENLVVEGIDWSKAREGDCYCSDDVILRVIQIGMHPHLPREQMKPICRDMAEHYIFCKVVYQGILAEGEPFSEY